MTEARGPRKNHFILSGNLPNNLTILRILLVPAMVTALVYYTPDRPYLHWVTLIVFLVACFTDALDGWLARRLSQQTAIGTYLDPLADKLLLVAGFLSLSFMSHLPASMRIPAWVTIAVITRDILILGGAMTIFFSTGKLKAEPLFIGKMTTAFQMLALTTALLGLIEPFRSVVYAVTVFRTFLSGVQYVRMGGRIVQPAAPTP